MKHTHEIEEYIESLKENALKLTAGIVTAATIATGSLALTACDDTQRVNASETTTQTNTTEVETEVTTGAVTDATTEVTTEIETSPTREKTQIEQNLENLLIQNHSEFENGLKAIEIICIKDGDFLITCRITALTLDKNGNLTSLANLWPSKLSPEEFMEIKEKIGNKFTKTDHSSYIISLDNLTAEESDYICSIYSNIYMSDLEKENN